LIRGAFERIANVATWLMAGALVVGFVAQPVAKFFGPYILHSMVILLAIAMVRLDVDRLRSYARRPAVIAAIVIVNLIAAPVLMWLLITPLDVPPGLEQGLVLMAAAPMISSAIAIANILELDSALAVAAMVSTYAVVPFTLPTLSVWLIGFDLGVSIFDMFIRLFATIAVPAATAFVLRRWVFRRETLTRNARAIDGLGVVFVVIFCLGIMDGITPFVADRPEYVLLTLAAAFTANIAMQIFGTVVFLKMGRREALTIGLVTGNTNLGLVMVVLADKASAELIAYFVLGQVPMYFLPVVALPIYRRLIGTPA
jgi:BASS family bile acid:Na+ symporter